MRQTSIGIVTQTPVIPAAIEDGTRGVRPLGQRAVCARSWTIALIRTPARIRLWTGDPNASLAPIEGISLSVVL